MSVWLDGRGCLTEAGLRAIQDAAPGHAPAEAAQHLAGCGRCQRRLLSKDELAQIGRGRSGEAPPLWRALLWVGVLVILSAAAFGFLLRR
jgi:hypothetical protein